MIGFIFTEIHIKMPFFYEHFLKEHDGGRVMVEFLFSRKKCIFKVYFFKCVTLTIKNLLDETFYLVSIATISRIKRKKRVDLFFKKKNIIKLKLLLYSEKQNAK